MRNITATPGQQLKAELKNTIHTLLGRDAGVAMLVLLSFFLLLTSFFIRNRCQLCYG